MYYDLSWDSGSNGAIWSTYTTLLQNNNLALVTGLSSGTTYQFMYRAQNIYGWSLYSPTISVLTMTEPHATNQPTTTVVGDSVQISWDLAYSGGSGIGITGYHVLIKRKDGSFTEDLTNCDGQTDGLIIANRKCSIPMGVLTSSFSLVLGDLVVAKVAAINSKGQGQYSGTNVIGALVETPPQSPQAGPARGPLTSETQLDVNWEFLTTYEHTGGTVITSYELQMDDGQGGTFVEMVGYTTAYSLNSFLITATIVSGRNYALQYRV